MKEENLSTLFWSILFWKMIRTLLLFALFFSCLIGAVIAALGNEWEKGTFLLLMMMIIDRQIDKMKE